MRKLFLMMAAATVFAGCNPDTPVTPAVTDSISIVPESQAFSSKGGEANVIVTSSGAWELTGGQDWAHPSAIKGDSGDAVKITVDANDSAEAREATFTFTCGTASDTFKITVEAKTEPSIIFQLVDNISEVAIKNEKQTVEIKIKTDVQYREIGTQIKILSGDGAVEGATPWLTYGATTSNEGIVSVFVAAAANASFENREAEVIISSDRTENPKATLKVKITQAQTDMITVEERNLEVPLAGGDVKIRVLSNIEFKTELGADSDWLTFKSNEQGLLTYTAAAIPSPMTRRQTTLTISPASGNQAPAAVVVNIVQKTPGIIRTAAYMKANQVPGKWTNPTPLENLGEFTLEALIYSDNYFKTIAEAGSASPVNAIMGIEGKFLIRVGDAGYEGNQLQVVYKPNNQEFKIGTGADAKLALSASEWHHIAVTFSASKRQVLAYIDGVHVGTMPPISSYITMSPINFGKPYTEVETETNRNFWINYAYETTRYLNGMYSEVRIWNRVLTVEEINAENHFYKIDDPANAAGLVGYWKFNDGVGALLKDHSASGNDLTASNTIEWRAVSIP